MFKYQQQGISTQQELINKCLNEKEHEKLDGNIEWKIPKIKWNVIYSGNEMRMKSQHMKVDCIFSYLHMLSSM